MLQTNPAQFCCFVYGSRLWFNQAINQSKLLFSAVGYIHTHNITTMLKCIQLCLRSLVYYGLALNSGSLAGDIYVNNAAGGLMELGAALLCLPAIAKFGCRNSVAFSLFLASFSCLFSTVAIQFAANNQGID